MCVFALEFLTFFGVYLFLLFDSRHEILQVNRILNCNILFRNSAVLYTCGFAFQP